MVAHPILAFAAAITIPPEPIIIVDLIIGACGLLLAAGAALVCLLQAVGLWRMLLSPAFVLCPVMSYTVLVAWRCKHPPSSEEAWGRSSFTSLTGLTAPMKIEAGGADSGC